MASALRQIEFEIGVRLDDLGPIDPIENCIYGPKSLRTSTVALARIAGIHLAKDGAMAVPAFKRHASAVTGSDPFVSLTPDGPTYWCRPDYVEFLSVCRGLQVTKWDPELPGWILRAAAVRSQTAAFQVEACLRAEERYVAMTVDPEILKEVAEAADDAGQDWVTTCERALGEAAVPDSGSGWRTEWRRVHSLLGEAEVALSAGDYDRGYSHISEVIPQLRTVIPEFRSAVDWRAAELVGRLEFTELMGLIPSFLQELEVPKVSGAVTCSALFETIDRLLASIFGIPDPRSLAVQVRPLRQPLG